MVGLWTDVWFYISSLGLLVSGALFFFLLGQYRAASAAADRAEPEVETRAQETDASATTPVQFVYAMPDLPAPKATVASVAEPRPPEDTIIIAGDEKEPDEKDRTSPSLRPAPKTPPVEAPPPPAPRARPAAPAPSEDVPQPSPSPAAAYLQGLKSQLDSLQSEVRGLSQRIDAANQRDETMIARLAEIARIVSGLKLGAGGASTTPEIASERATLKELPYDFDEKMQNGISAVIDAHFGGAAEAAAEKDVPAAAAPEPSAPSSVQAEASPGAEASEPSEQRRGPVWPV